MVRKRVHLTGFNAVIIGAQWQVDPSDRTKVGSLFSFLEDRRVLFSPYEAEVPGQCADSVDKIRGRITELLESKVGDQLAARLNRMRGACRRFLSCAPQGDWNRVDWRDIVFNQALGELRGVFGVSLAELAVTYDIDVEDDLRSIMPIDDADARRNAGWM